LVEQLLFSPLGLVNPAKNGLLVTPLRIIDNKNCFIVPATDIKRTTLPANMSALNYYLKTKEGEIKENLLMRCLKKYYGRDYVFDWEPVPIEVTLDFGKSINKFKNKCLAKYAEEKFLSYIWSIEHSSRYIHISREDQHVLKRLETRYSDNYCKKVKDRMAWVAANYNQKSAVLLTLTLDPKKYDWDQLEMWLTIKKDFHEFIKKLRIYFKRCGRTFPPYIHAIEAQKNGNPHLHIVFLNSTRLTDWRRIQQYWGKGAIRINRTKDSQKVRYPVNYYIMLHIYMIFWKKISFK
jgi:hypothetical protein